MNDKELINIQAKDLIEKLLAETPAAPTVEPKRPQTLPVKTPPKPNRRFQPWRRREFQPATTPRPKASAEY